MGKRTKHRTSQRAVQPAWVCQPRRDTREGFRWGSENTGRVFSRPRWTGLTAGPHREPCLGSRLGNQRASPGPISGRASAQAALSNDRRQLRMPGQVIRNLKPRSLLLNTNMRLRTNRRLPIQCPGRHNNNRLTLRHPRQITSASTAESSRKRRRPRQPITHNLPLPSSPPKVPGRDEQIGGIGSTARPPTILAMAIHHPQRFP